MFKKILVLLAVLMMLSAPCFARDAFKGTVIAETRLDADPTSVTSSGVDVSQYDKVAFWVTYDETESGGGVSMDITLEISYDNVTWLSAKFYDYTGAATLQTTENLAADASYYFYWNRDLNIPWARVKCVGNATDADDLIDVTVNYSAQK